MSLVSSASDTTVPQKEQSVNSNISENEERYSFNDEKTDSEKLFEGDKSTYHDEGPGEKKYSDFLDRDSNVDNAVENNIIALRGETYVGTDEFRRLQEESRGMPEEEIQQYH